MRSFIAKGSKLQGIRFDGENRDKIVEALGIRKQFCESWLNEDLKQRQLFVKAPGMELGIIKTGDWVLIGTGIYRILSDADLQMGYEAL